LRVVFSKKAWEHYRHWQAADLGVLERLNTLIDECLRHPFSGTGRPEPLRGELSGLWSRRLTLEDRLVYRVVGKGEDQRLEIAQCRYHY
jgi:toxin YoeB